MKSQRYSLQDWFALIGVLRVTQPHSKVPSWHYEQVLVRFAYAAVSTSKKISNTHAVPLHRVLFHLRNENSRKTVYHMLESPFLILTRLQGILGPLIALILYLGSDRDQVSDILLYGWSSWFQISNPHLYYNVLKCHILSKSLIKVRLSLFLVPDLTFL